MNDPTIPPTSAALELTVDGLLEIRSGSAEVTGILLNDGTILGKPGSEDAACAGVQNPYDGGAYACVEL